MQEQRNVPYANLLASIREINSGRSLTWMVVQSWAPYVTGIVLLIESVDGRLTG